MATVTYIDYSGGYATDMPNDLMPDNMLLTSENWYWDSEFKKRQGVSTYDILTGYSGVMGWIRVYMNSEWTTIYALDNGTNVTFWRATGTAVTQVGSKTWTKGKKVRMASLNGEVVAVNGTDKPIIIYYSSTHTIEDLEQHDARLREYADWYAGQYATGAGTYTTDTDDAQDVGTDDFQVASATSGDGFFISSPLVFTKVVLTNCQEFASGVAAYEYYASDGSWKAVTLTTTPTWIAAEGDRTIEFDIPSDWVVYDSAVDYIADRYAFRVRFTTSPGAVTYCDQIAVSYTRNISNIQQILGGSQFHLVHMHSNRIWLGNAEGVAYSPNNLLTGWYDYYVEYFAGDGNSLLAMRSYSDTLLIFKSNCVWLYSGNSYEDFYKKRFLDVGTISEDGPVVVNKTICFPSKDAIYIYSGDGLKQVSGHIATNYNAYTKTNCVGTEYNGFCWLSFPTNNVVLLFDPDTYKKNDMGEGMVSFYKFTSYHVESFLKNNGDGDNGLFLGYDGSGATAIIKKLQDGTYGDSGVAFSVTMQTKYSSLGKVLYQKRYTRTLYDVAIAGDYTVTLYSNDSTSAGTFTLATGTGAGHYVEDVSMPYELDGRNFSTKIVNATTLNAKLYAMTTDASIRRF